MTLEHKDFPTDVHGWSELLSARRAARPINGARRVAWVVVGAGLTGLACARRLGQLHPGQEIILLEARQVGQGASGRNSGFVVATSQFPGGVVKDQVENYRRVNRINQAGLELLSEQVAANAIE